MDRIELTEQDLIEAILTAQDTPGGENALTARELTEATGRSYRAVMERLRRLAQSDRLEVHFVQRRGLDGKVQRVPGYRLRGVDEAH